MSCGRPTSAAQASKSQSYSQGMATLCTMIADASRVEAREAVLVYTAMSLLRGGDDDSDSPTPPLSELRRVCNELLRQVETAAGLPRDAVSAVNVRSRLGQ